MGTNCITEKNSQANEGSMKDETEYGGPGQEKEVFSMHIKFLGILYLTRSLFLDGFLIQTGF